VEKIALTSIDSTNSFAKEQLAKGTKVPLLVTAEFQSGGRGQYDRPFSSPPGGAYFSLAIRPELEQQDIPLITLATGVACAGYLQKKTSCPVMLKWPNDLFVGEKKLGGILCESVCKNNAEIHTVIGVGVNVNSRLSHFATELHPILTSVYEQTGQVVQIETIIEQLAETILEHITLLKRSKKKIIAQWQEHDYLHERCLEYVAGDIHIRAKGNGILANGKYRIIDEAGVSHDVMSGQLRPL